MLLSENCIKLKLALKFQLIVKFITSIKTDCMYHTWGRIYDSLKTFFKISWKYSLSK